MCLYISAILPSQANIRQLTQIFEKHGRALRPVEIKSLSVALANGEKHYITTSGHCDCGSVLGGAVTKNEDQESKLRQKYKRKGWSQAKIDRAIAENAKQSKSQAAGQSAEAAAELRMWPDLIQEVLSLKTPYMGLLLHEYEGKWEKEEITLVKRQVQGSDRIDEALLQNLERDVLYEFRRS